MTFSKTSNYELQNCFFMHFKLYCDLILIFSKNVNDPAIMLSIIELLLYGSDELLSGVSTNII